MSLSVGDAAPNLTLADHEGNELQLSSLWQESPRVMFFPRHLG